MFVQEAAILAIGQLRYKPARDKLVTLLSTAKQNGRIAAQGVLRCWGETAVATWGAS